MGGGVSISYAVPVTPKIQGESAIYRSPQFKDKLCDGLGNLKTMKELLINSGKQYGNLPALGMSGNMQELSLRTKEETRSSILSHIGKLWRGLTRSEAP